jgi:hypothetical protein
MLLLDNNTLLLILLGMAVVIVMLLGVILHLVNKLYATGIVMKDLVPLHLLIALRDEGVKITKQIVENTPSTRDDFLPGALTAITDPFLKNTSTSGEAVG